MKHILHYIGLVIGLAAAYYIGGRLGLLLLIPPGQATAFWPPAGIALAGLLLFGGRYWPGVFLGALGTSLSHADVLTQEVIIQQAAMIAAGATLQAWFGAFLVRRAVGPPYVLERVRDILKLIVLGGVLSCLINTFVATYTLNAAGVVPDAYFTSHLFIWWAGDMLGVVVFAPVMLLLFAPTGGAQGVTPQRKAVVSVSLLIVFGLMAFLFSLARQQDVLNQKRALTQISQRIALQFEKDLSVYLNTLVATERFIASSEYVSADEFENFSREFFDFAPGLAGVSWVPKVEGPEREAFVRSIRAQGYPDFEIRRRHARGKLAVSEERPFYLTVAYIVPYASNAPAHGLDIYGEDPVTGDLRRRSIDKARDSGQQIATARFPIVQAEQQYGFVVYHPVYKIDVDGADLQAHRENLIGFVNGIFLLPLLAEEMARQAQELGLYVVLRDLDAPPDRALLFDSRTADHKEGPPESYEFSGLLSHAHQFTMAGRVWQARFVENAAVRRSGINWNLWSVALGGVLYCGLFGIFMLVVTARTAVVERVVRTRTDELARANAELEEFAYRTSHDLRAPIISSHQLVDVASEALDEKDYDTVRASLEHTQGALSRLESLIEDILQLTEVNNIEEEHQKVDFGELLDQALAKLASMDGFGRLRIEKDLRFEGDLFVKRLRLRVIVENLLSNAVKYQDRACADSFIRIETRREDDNFILVITDNGLGIPADKQDKLFGMFRRFHTRVSFGSGLGLYLVQKSASVLGGDVTFRDPGQGASFIVKIPLGEEA